MFISADSLDDLLTKVFKKLLISGIKIQPTKGPARELAGTLLRLKSPRARLSRTDKRGILFSCLGEWLWYLAGTNSLDYIKYYLPHYSNFSDDKKSVYGGYGPRLFGAGQHDQIFRVINLLRRKQDSRQAVIQIFDRRDLLKPHKDIPCTCTFQFMIRNRRLDMLTTMRSNDVYMGLPHDIFAFTMIQELVARAIGVELGEYKHFVGSLHLYDCDRDHARAYLDEGWQSHVPMPPMPLGDQWNSVRALLKAESQLRGGRTANFENALHDSYWIDLFRILKIFSLTKRGAKSSEIRSVMTKMSEPMYAPYLKKRLEKTTSKNSQLDIFASIDKSKTTQGG